MKLKAYEISYKEIYGNEVIPHYTLINHFTASKAKYKYYLDSDSCEPFDEWIPFIRCRSVDCPVTTEAFKHNAEYRCIPFAYVGMMVEVGGKLGVISGHNSSANLNVIFEDGQEYNCHPNHKIKYFDKSGNLIKEF